jgi:hypothetical protein
MQRRAIIGGIVLVGTGVVLGTTVFRADIAQATGLAQSVTVNNLPTQPVPVHEQGTASVKVTNTSLSLAPAAPITGGGGAGAAAASIPPFPVVLSAPAIADAVSIHMTSGVQTIELSYKGSQVAAFFGPAQQGNEHIDLAPARPVEFDTITCTGTFGDVCSVGWIGDQP